MATVTGSVTPSLTFTATTTIDSGSNQKVTTTLPANTSPTAFSSGSGSLAVTKMFVRTIALSASTPVTLDLTTLSSGYGDTAFSAVKVLGVFDNETAATGKKVTVGNAASNAFTGPLSGTTPKIDVEAGCGLILYTGEAAGYDCTTNKNLKLDPGSNAVSVTIVVAGN